MFPTRADVVSALLASFHWGVPVVTYEPKAYVGANGIVYGDALEIVDAQQLTVGDRLSDCPGSP